jgi:hypothetical protein
MPQQIDEVGNDRPNSAEFYPGIMRVVPITASDSGTLSIVGLEVKNADGNLRYAIYSTYGGVDGGHFSGLLGQSASTAAHTGWNDLAIPGVPIVKGTTYYIAVQCDSSSLACYLIWSGIAYYCNISGGSYTTFPDPTNTVTSESKTLNLHMTYIRPLS